MPDLTDRSNDISIHHPTTNVPVTTTTDGAKERLDVSAILVPSITSVQSGNIGELVKAGRVYSVALTLNMAIAAFDNPVILLRNPVGSLKTLYIYRILTGVFTSNTFVDFKVFANPTITTNGTSQTPVNRAVGGGFGASVMTAFSFPTVSANGTPLLTQVCGQNTNSFDGVEDFSIQVSPNNNLLITANPSANNRESKVTVIYAEF